MKRILNLQRAPEDKRDLKFGLIREDHLAEPRLVDLTPFDTAIMDQLEWGTCVVNSSNGLHDFCRKKVMRGVGRFNPSARMPAYSLILQKNGQLGQDAGANMRDGVDILHTWGAIPETLFPYTAENLYKLPTAEQTALAAKSKNSLYYGVDTLKDMRSCLISGFPFSFGFDVPSAFQDKKMATTGEMSLKDWATTTEGGHAVMAIGYNDMKQAFLVRNSWGTTWAMRGYFWYPYSCMNQDAYNHYTLRI